MRGNRSLRDIQKTSGVSYSYLRRIEKGVDPRSGNDFIPTPQTLKKLSIAYNYPYIDLLDKAGYLPNISNEEKERLSINNEFQDALEDILENNLNEIIKDQEFIPAVFDEIQKIERKYNEYFEEGEKLTPQFLRDIVSNADWQQEWIQEIIASVVSVSRNYIYKDVKELTKFLSLPNISFKDKILSEDDRNRILNMLNVLFPDS